MGPAPALAVNRVRGRWGGGSSMSEKTWSQGDSGAEKMESADVPVDCEVGAVASLGLVEVEGEVKAERGDGTLKNESAARRCGRVRQASIVKLYDALLRDCTTWPAKVWEKKRCFDIIKFLCLLSQGAIAKWLRRQIRNLFLYEGAGSNPAGVGSFYSPFTPLTACQLSSISRSRARPGVCLRGTAVLDKPCP